MSVKKIVKGFTLLEMAVVIAIMGIVMAGFVLPMLGQIKIRSQLLELQKYKETKHTLEEIKAALLGYMQTNSDNALPCPDTNATAPDGNQDDCKNSDVEGYVPWADLGLMKGNDAWGNPIRYRVNRQYATKISPTSFIATGRILKIKNIDGNWLSNSNDSKKEDSHIVAILFSCGKNAKIDANNRVGINCDNTIALPSNAENDYYIQDIRDYKMLSEIPTSFDDSLIWISKYQVINQLTNAGKWK